MLLHKHSLLERQPGLLLCTCLYSSCEHQFCTWMKSSICSRCHCDTPRQTRSWSSCTGCRRCPHTYHQLRTSDLWHSLHPRCIQIHQLKHILIFSNIPQLTTHFPDFFNLEENCTLRQQFLFEDISGQMC